ncbi:MAG: winged helix-turn-helix domain-containing protein [Chloroflexi bacterium]|nr:winged helix-turn-helix domain-containing protein [Chloroflexota bacterium]
MAAPLPELHVSADHARRFLVRRHLLDPSRSLPAKAASVLRVVDRLGSLQFDPLEVPGARNHDLVLHNRIAGYQREWCDRWLYGKDRRLIELYNKSLNILPVRELPFYRLAWTDGATRYEGLLAAHSTLANRIRDHIRESGPASTASFRDVEDRIQWWWDSDAASTGTKAARAMMETMFVTGELGISRREGSRRFYDLIERVVPARLLDTHAAEAEQLRHRLLSRHRGVGLMSVGGPSELVLGTGKAPDRARITAALIDEGALVPVAVEGFREVRHVLAEEMSILRATAAAPPTATPSVSFLAPLDPLIWDRRLVKGLFGFDYIWEVYVPAPKRRHGYYVLPLLFGDRLVGRIEPRLERASRALRIAGIWFEDGVGPMEEPGFIPALAIALDAYRRFVGARAVTWPRTKPGREIAGALRRIA